MFGSKFPDNSLLQLQSNRPLEQFQWVSGKKSHSCAPNSRRCSYNRRRLLRQHKHSHAELECWCFFFDGALFSIRFQKTARDFFFVVMSLDNWAHEVTVENDEFDSHYLCDFYEPANWECCIITLGDVQAISLLLQEPDFTKLFCFDRNAYWTNRLCSYKNISILWNFRSIWHLRLTRVVIGGAETGLVSPTLG